jgi:hypothetical protein
VGPTCQWVKGHDQNFARTCQLGMQSMLSWHAASVKIAILNEVLTKNGKSVGVIIIMDFELVSFVIMANM